MKALVNEVVQGLRKRLEYLNIKIAELTGESNLIEREFQEATIIVATPEKWNIVFRKQEIKASLIQVKMIIIDEVHLLGETRGPVLEEIICRVKLL